MIFYEAPHKIGATLRDLAAALGDREIAIVREDVYKRQEDSGSAYAVCKIYARRRQAQRRVHRSYDA